MKRTSKPAPQLHPELAAAIREVLDRSTHPMNLAKLRSALPGPYKVPAKLKDALAALLADEVRANRLHEWPGGKFWNRNCRAWAEPAMLAAASAAPVASAKVIGAVSKVYGRPASESLLAELVANGSLIRVPLFGGAKAKVCSRVLDEAAFRAELEDAKKVIEAGYRRLWLESATGGVTHWPQPLTEGPGSLDEPQSSIDERLLNAIAELEPRKGLLVTAPRLYRAFSGASKVEIDDALIRLQDARRVILHRHSHPQSQDAEQLIAGLYVGACLRVDQ